MSEEEEEEEEVEEEGNDYLSQVMSTIELGCDISILAASFCIPIFLVL